MRHLSFRFTRAFAVCGLTASLVLALAQPGSAASGEEPPEGAVIVEVSAVVGSGCPKGTAAVSVTPDNDAISVAFSSFRASVGLGSLPADVRKNCLLSILIRSPRGFTYAIPGGRYQGFAHLEQGSRALLRTTSTFAGLSTSRTSTHEFAGPFDSIWAAEDSYGLADLLWLPCGEDRNINLNTELRVIPGTSDVTTTSSFIAMDAADIDTSASYQLLWRRCPA